MRTQSAGGTPGGLLLRACLISQNRVVKALNHVCQSWSRLLDRALSWRPERYCTTSILDPLSPSLQPSCSWNGDRRTFDHVVCIREDCSDYDGSVRSGGQFPSNQSLLEECIWASPANSYSRQVQGRELRHLILPLETFTVFQGLITSDLSSLGVPYY